MKPNLLLFALLVLISTLLFLSLPKDGPYTSAQSEKQPAQGHDASAREVSAELQRMRGDYAKLLQEMAVLRTHMEKKEAAPAENRRTAMPSENREDESAPGVTIYLDTSKLPTAPNRGQEWTAVGFHDAGRAPDGSRQAVLSITKVNRPQGQPDQHGETARAIPVSHWQ